MYGSCNDSDVILTDIQFISEVENIVQITN